MPPKKCTECTDIKLLLKRIESRLEGVEKLNINLEEQVAELTRRVRDISELSEREAGWSTVGRKRPGKTVPVPEFSPVEPELELPTTTPARPAPFHPPPRPRRQPSSSARRPDTIAAPVRPKRHQLPPCTTGAANEGLRVAERRTAIHVWKLDAEVTASNVSDYIASKSHTVYEVEPLKAKGHYASFKIVAREEVAIQLLNLDFWPAGLYVRRYYERRPSATSTDAAAPETPKLPTTAITISEEGNAGNEVGHGTIPEPPVTRALSKRAQRQVEN